MLRDYFKLHFIIILWGFTAITGKWMTIDAPALVWYRTFVAALGVWALMRWRGLSLQIQGGDLWRMLGTGALVAAHWFFFFQAARISTVSICLIGLASTAFWTSLLEPILLRRPFKWYELFLGAIMVGAMYAISQFEDKYFWGLILGVLSALNASLFTIINSRLTQRQHYFAITFYEMCGAFLAISALVLVSFFVGADWAFLPAAPINWLTDGLNLFFLAVICTVYAYSVSVELMRRIPAFAVNLSVNLEPVYGIALAALFFGEWREMTTEFYASASVILLSVLAYPLIRRWDDRRIAGK